MIKSLVQPMVKSLVQPMVPLPLPILDMPLSSDLNLSRGVGSATFTRSTTGTYISKDDGLIKTVAIDEARFESGGVLIEGASTNLVTRSEEFNDAAWTKAEASISADSSTAPDGAMTADNIVPTTNNTRHSVFRSSQSITGHTYSVCAKANGYDWILLTSHSTSAPSTRGTFFNVSNGTIGSVGTAGQNPKIEALSNGWFRCSIDEGDSPSSIFTVIVSNADGVEAFVGDGASGVLAWGATREALPFASSYIPTTTTAVTRTADDFSLPSSGNFNEAEGTIVLDVAYTGDTGSPQNCFSITDGSISNRTQILRNPSTNLMRVFIASGGVGQVDITGAALESGVSQRVAVTYKENEVILYQDGVQTATDASALMPSGLSSITLGRLLAASERAFCKVKNLKTFDVALTADQVKFL